MAISRNDPEWQRVVAQAALAGVTFQQIRDTFVRSETRPGRFETAVWEITMPDGERFEAPSKYKGARIALNKLVMP